MLCPECGEVTAPGPLDARRAAFATSYRKPLWLHELVRVWRGGPVPGDQTRVESR